jgi:hypothetical protein
MRTLLAPRIAPASFAARRLRNFVDSGFGGNHILPSRRGTHSIFIMLAPRRKAVTPENHDSSHEFKLCNRHERDSLRTPV